VASVASEGMTGMERRATRRLRAAVLGPRGGGTTRRRASDAFRLRFAIVVVAVSVPVMRASSAAELWVGDAVRGDDRRGGHRAALPEPPAAPAGVIAGHAAPGGEVAARPALDGGGYRLDRRPGRSGRGHRPGPARSGGRRSSPAAAAAARVLDPDVARGALVHLQRSGLDPVTVEALHKQRDLLPWLRSSACWPTFAERWM